MISGTPGSDGNNSLFSLRASQTVETPNCVQENSLGILERGISPLNVALCSPRTFSQRFALQPYTLHTGLNRVQFPWADLTFMCIYATSGQNPCHSSPFPLFGIFPALDALALPSTTVLGQYSKSSLSFDSFLTAPQDPPYIVDVGTCLHLLAQVVPPFSSS